MMQRCHLHIVNVIIIMIDFQITFSAQGGKIKVLIGFDWAFLFTCMCVCMREREEGAK